MSAAIPSPNLTMFSAARGRMSASIGYGVGVFRLPEDPIYYGIVRLNNVIVGSRYRITDAGSGTELALGVAASTTEDVSVPVFTSGQLMNITIRNASGVPAFRIFDTAVYASRDRADVFVLQQPDE